MALRINLYHEVLRTRKQAQYDPLKLATMFIIIIGIGLVGWYVVELGKKSSAMHEYETQEALQKQLEPQEAKAKEQEAEYTKQLATMEKLGKRMEERFYWAPVLEDLGVVVPASVQITKFAGDMTGEGLRKITISMEGIAAGEEPRATAEDFRTALTEKLGKKFKNTAATFKTLDEAADTVALDGKNLRTATFNISLTFNFGTEPPPPPAPKAAGRVRKVAQQEQ